MNHLMNTNSAGARLSLVVALLTALVACAGPTSPSRDESPTHPTARVAVSGRLASGGFATQSTADSVQIERADTVVAIPVSAYGMRAQMLPQARTGTIQPDGSFSIEIPTGQGSWIVLAVDSSAIGFEKVVGHMVVDEGTARLHTLPIENAEGDVEFGTLSFDAESMEFVAEYGMSTYAGTMNLSVEELRAIARTDSMSKLAINLYANYTPTDYWNMMTVWGFVSDYQPAVGAYAPALGAEPTNLVYTRFSWETPEVTIHEVVDETALIEVFPPAPVVDNLPYPPKTYGPETPFTNRGHQPENTRSPNGEFELNAIHYFEGGLVVVVGRDGSYGLDVRTMDPSTGMLLPGVWRVRVNGQDRAWFDVRIGSPFDSDGNIIALVPEPRLTFDSEGRFERIDVRFAQQEAPGTFSPVSLPSALNQIQWGQIVLRDTTHDIWDKVDDAREHGFSVDTAHPDIITNWQDFGDHEWYVTIQEIQIATRTYGEDFSFVFRRR